MNITATAFWSEEDGGFIAVCPELPGCSAFGKTQDSAIAELQNAAKAWIEAMGSAGNAVPSPSSLESAAVWHERHAAAYPPGHPHRIMHENVAANLRSST